MNKTINLTEEQATGVQTLLEFESSLRPSASLIGFAGTGKTTIIKEFLSDCKTPPNKTFVSAPTHKAKMVIQQVTKRRGITIQSLLGIRPSVELNDYDYNNPKFKQVDYPRISDYKNGIGIIDESSMLNKDLTKQLLKIAGRHNVKLIFVGDDYQLPPVNEMYSTALTTPKTVVKLSTVIRQSEFNPIVDIIDTLRKDIENGTSNAIEELKKNPKRDVDGEGYEVLTDTRFKEVVKDLFASEEYAINPEHAKYISWTNNAVTQFNSSVRAQIYGDNSVPLYKGETLLSYKNISLDGGRSNWITNSEEFVVQSIVEDTLPLNFVDGQYEYLKILRVECVSNMTLNPVILNIVDRKDEGSFRSIFNERLSEALEDRKKWKQFFSFKNNKLVLGDLFNNIGESYPKKPKYIGKDLDYGYGITVHKSQGSTYNNVIVNVRNILRNQDVVERNKLLYVALTRASKFTYIYL